MQMQYAIAPGPEEGPAAVVEAFNFLMSQPDDGRTWLPLRRGLLKGHLGRALRPAQSGVNLLSPLDRGTLANGLWPSLWGGLAPSADFSSRWPAWLRGVDDRA